MSRSPCRANALKTRRSFPGERGHIARSVRYVAGQLLLSGPESRGKRDPLATCERQRQNARAPLRAAFKKEAIQQQQNHGADDRHDPARWLSGLVPPEGLAEVSGNERACDAE